MKRKTTKEILAESFKELSQTKPISKITIADITENCSMTSPTFYRHFKDKYDLIAWIYVQEAQKNVDKIGYDGYLWKDTLLDGLRYYAANHKYMVNALKHTSGRDSFINQMTKMNIGYIMDEVRKKNETKSIPEDLTALIKIYCYGTGQYLCEWLMDSKPASCEEVAAAMEACIPEKLKPYLCQYINRVRPENNENKLFLSLTAEGKSLKERALDVPSRMQDCIPLSEDELYLLRDLLNRALAEMSEKRRR